MIGMQEENLAGVLLPGIQTGSGTRRCGVFIVQTPPAENHLGAVVSTRGGGGLLNRDKTWIKINMCRQCSCVRTDTSFSITAGAVADGMKMHTWCKAKVQLCFPRSSKLSHLVCASVQQMGKGLVSSCVLLACVEGVNLKRVLLLLLRIMWECRQATVSKIHRYSNTVYIYHFIFQFKCKKLGYLNSGELQRIQRGITHSFQAIFVFQSVRPIFTWLTYPAWLTTE